MNPLRVLVIDDEPAVRQIIAAHVKQAGYNVDQAGGAAEAASKLVRGDVDIALCDIQMPDGNGLDLVKSIRESGIDTTFIMVTAFATMETAIEALRAGATDFITKPLRTEELLHRLSQVDPCAACTRKIWSCAKSSLNRRPSCFGLARHPCLKSIA